MPELPEVEALALDLKGRLVDRVITRIDLAAFSALKTFDPPLHSLHGTLVEDVTRHGKFLDITASGTHLIMHLARAGWVRWRDEVPTLPARPNSKNPLAARIVIAGTGTDTNTGTDTSTGLGANTDTGTDTNTNTKTDKQSGLDVTEAGTKKSLAIYVVRDPQDVPGIARLGPDPLDDAFTIDVLSAILQSEGRKQIKGVLRHQGTIAGIGNAYSDELLHAARMSPYKPSNGLDDDELQGLYDAIRGVLGAAVERSRGLHASELKGEKKTNLAVHGRTGQPCPVCGDVVREVSFADSSLQYCATCQTGGKPLADRRLSRLLK